MNELPVRYVEHFKDVWADVPGAGTIATSVGPRGRVGRRWRNALDVIPVGHKVGMLDYQWPQPPSTVVREERLPRAKEVAVITVGTGRNGRARYYTVWRKLR